MELVLAASNNRELTSLIASPFTEELYRTPGDYLLQSPLQFLGHSYIDCLIKFLEASKE